MKDGWARPVALSAARCLLDQLAKSAEALAVDLGADPESQVAWWSAALARQCLAARGELSFLAPWVETAQLHDGLEILPRIDSILTLRALAGLDVGLSTALDSERAQIRTKAVQGLVIHAGEFADMEYGFLYDRQSRLLSVMYNVDARRRDASCYDLPGR